MAKILFYSPDHQKSAAMISLCRKLKLPCTSLQAADFDCTLASILAGNPQKPLNRTTKMPLFAAKPELLVFSGLSDQHLDGFLKEYRNAGISPVALKAVVTPTNFLWTVYELTQELAKEHAVLG